HTYRALLGRAAAVHALDRLSLEVAEGGARGLIGLNGAGKTTLLRVLLGFLRPSVGSATIAGQSPRSYVERHGVGYVPERVEIAAGWAVGGALQADSLLGDVADDARQRVYRVLVRLTVEEIRDRRVLPLSKADLPRLVIAQAIVCDRRRMVHDAPTGGLTR